MSSSRPVPFLSAPKCAVAYHWLVQGRAESPPAASAAPCGSSPSARPAGPNAATLAGASACTVAGLAVDGLTAGDDWIAPSWAELPWTAAAGGGFCWPTGAGRELAAVADGVRPTPETNL